MMFRFFNGLIDSLELLAWSAGFFVVFGGLAAGFISLWFFLSWITQ